MPNAARRFAAFAAFAAFAVVLAALAQPLFAQPMGEALLLDTGVGGNGRVSIESPAAVSGPGAEAFQAFTITDDAGWRITRIVLEGQPDDPGDSGLLLGSIVASLTSGATASPVLDDTLASGFGWDFTGAPSGSNLAADADFVLGAGDYFLRVAPGSDETDVFLSTGRSGDPVLTRGLPGGNFFGVGPDPLAVKIYGEVIPAPASAGVFVLGAFALRRRR